MVGKCHVIFFIESWILRPFFTNIFSCNLTQNYLKKKQTIKAIWARFLHNPIQQPHTNSVTTVCRFETCMHNKMMYVAERDLSVLCFDSCEEFFGREKLDIEIFLSTMPVQENS